MTYKFRIKSTFIQFLVMICFIIPFVYLLDAYKHHLNDTAILISMGVFALGSLFLSSFMAKGIAEVKLSNNEIIFNWLKRPIITTQSNQTIKFADIDSWIYRRESKYNYFIIRSKKAENMILYRDSTWDDEKDDFGSFLKKFATVVDNYNNGIFSKDESGISNPEIISTKIIDEENEFHKTGGSTFLLYVYILAIIFGTVSLITKWDSFSPTQLSIIISGMSGCLYLIIRHIQIKNK